MNRTNEPKNKKSGLPKYCVKKQNAGLRAYYYFQRKDYRIPLPHPNHPGFYIAYETALKEMPNASHLAQAAALKTLPIPLEQIDEYFSKKQNGAKQRAKKLGRDYTLPKDWAAKQYQHQMGQCGISGLIMRPSTGRFDFLSPSIDRKDSSGGYTPDNCHLVAFGVNVAKGTMELTDFIKMCRQVVAHARRTERERNEKVAPPFETPLRISMDSTACDGE